MAPPRKPACRAVSEGKEDALLVLDAARRLVTLAGFWDGDPNPKPAKVVRIGGNECA